MNILYTCDNNFIWIAAVSMCSLFENNKKVDEIKVFLLSDNVSDTNKKNLKQIAYLYDRYFEAIDIEELNIPSVLYSSRWPKSAYMRLFSGYLLPKYVKKILYLDCDIIVNRTLDDLWKKEISGYCVYGVKDCVGSLYKKNIGLTAESPYINAGVLLMNVEKLQDIDMYACINEFFFRYGKKMNYADQDVLNGILKSQVGILEPEYDMMTILFYYSYKEVLKLRKPTNYYSKEEIGQAVKNPAIIHFTTCMFHLRPWFKGSDHPYRTEFEKYLNMIPWFKQHIDYNLPSSSKNKFLRIISFLPRNFSCSILGFIHSILLPLYKKIKL